MATWWFIFVILIVKDKNSALTSDGMLGSSTVGLALMVGAKISGRISGGCLNPAVGISLTMWSWIDDVGDMGDLWIYIIGPLLGGLIAGLVHRFLHRPAIEHFQKRNNNWSNKIQFILVSETLLYQFSLFLNIQDGLWEIIVN